MTEGSARVGLLNIGSLLLLGFLWGSSFTVVKIAVGSIPAASVAAGRIVIAALAILAYALLRGAPPPRNLAAWRSYFIVGMLGTAFPFMLISWGQVTIDSGLAAILMAFAPLSTLILAHFFSSDEPMSVLRLIGILVGFSGIVVLIGPAALAGLGDDAIRQGAVLLGAVCYAGAGVAAKHLPKESDIANSAGILIAGAIVWIPVTLVVDRPWSLAPSSASLWALLVLGLLPTALATLVYLRLIRLAGATFVSLSNYLVPLFGVFLGVLFLDEVLRPQAVAALALVLTGIALTRRPD